ncbi:MAG: hypothetical protein AABW82_04200 [Nanoarchaeota archaeon]
MNIEQIASRISELTGEMVSPAQITNLPIQKAGNEGFKPINSKLEVLADHTGKPYCVNFHTTGRKFNTYQASTYNAKSLLEAWTGILTTFEDMLINPTIYRKFGDELLDSR